MVNKQSSGKTKKFIRQDIHKKKRLAVKWRKPRGIDSKQRLMLYNRSIVKPGYGTAAEDKGKYRGLKKVQVSKLSEIKDIDPKKQIVEVSGKIGLRTKLPLLKELVKRKITIHNFANPEKYIADKEKMLKDNKEKKIKIAKKKQEKQEKQEKGNIDDKVSKDITEEEKKKTEKKEIDKLLTKKV
ncbi:MAG: eL32 family ribosomal protein [Nanoarchaeota archaeon]